MCTETSPRPWAIQPIDRNRARIVGADGKAVTGPIRMEDAVLIARAVVRPGADGFGKRPAPEGRKSV